MYPNQIRTTRQATAPPRSKKKTVYTLALRRIADIRNLLRWRQSVGLSIPNPDEIILLAGPSIHALAGMNERLPHRQTQRKHEGLDVERALDFLASIHPINRRALYADIQDMMNAYDWRPDPEQPFTPSAAHVGKALSLTRDERENLELWTMEAIDEAAEARKARKAVEKREADRLRQRAKRRAAAAREGRITGGPTLEDRAPWTALGISRRTYFRRIKAGDLNPSKAAKGNEFARDTDPSRTSIQKERGARHASVTDPIISLRDKSQALGIAAGRAMRPRTNAARKDFPGNVISIEAFRKELRQDFASRAIALLEGSMVLLRNQSAQLDREDGAGKASAAQARLADDREGAA